MRLLLALSCAALAAAACDLDAYATWYEQFGETMEYNTLICRIAMKQLRLDLAGRHGPVEQDNAFDIMCSTECTLMDDLHQDALATSGCDCIELSTPNYHVENDFCKDNSARIMCDVLEWCGEWGCRIGDYMCMRYEYNKRDIPHRGPGDCSPGSVAAPSAWLTAVLAAAVGGGLLGWPRR